MKNYIGMDAHSKTCTFVVLDQEGKELATQKIPTGEAEILRFVRSLPGDKQLTFEGSSISRWLYGVLHREVSELVVCNPCFVVRRTGPKSDFLDAQHLAQQLRGGFLTPVFRQDNFLFELRPVVAAYEALVGDLVRWKCRYKSLFRSEAINTQGSTIYRRVERAKELKSEMHQFLAEEMFTRMFSLQKVKTKYRRLFREWMKGTPEILVLDSIPGVGPVRACIIAAYVGSPHRFANKHKFWSYCELVRHNFVSDGESYGKKRIPANRSLKSAFMGAAQVVIGGNSSLRTYYDRMLKQGFDARAAKKNVARKIAAISLALMKSKKRYDDTILKGEKPKENLNIA